ncbi:J domain-containing protein [Sandaracinus amylolyticus]|uniref:Basic proline-rich protein n=1 Tax=Sandaracinus amylolyticus TaxID=927083 RepID=A0A0F6SGT3_9BACT|nr:DnaJ domain-containing protein [Sandaracinus amylolyticus]AKF09244.1 Basic proline-rich protein precursor [Sandaracinus amylolyticus]
MDLRSLPLTPTEGFILSRIDGVATIDDLSDLTNLDVSDVVIAIGRLIELGAVEWADGTISLPRASNRPPTPSQGVHRRAIPSPRAFERPNVTESEPPSATREPTRVKVPPPARVPVPSSTSPTSPPPPSSATPSDTIDPRRLEGRVDASRPPTARPGNVARVNVRDRPPSNPTVPTADATARRPTPPAMPATQPPPASPPASEPAAVVPSSAGSLPAEIDLPPERRKRIDELYPVLELLDHYEVLGLRPNAELKDIRATYFELSKVFHPDTAFRKSLGPYKAKMEAIFTRLTEAYEVLGKKKPRAEYDAYLALQGDTRAVEDAMRAPAKPAASPSPPAPSPPPEPPPPPSPAPTESPARALSDEGRRRARELLERRLQGARPATTTTSSGAIPSPTSSAPRARDEVLRDLASSLKSTASLTGGIDRISRHQRDAQRLEAEGDLAGASRELRMATALAPQRDDLRLEHERVSRLLAAQLADKYEQAAQYEEKHRKWAAAAISWSKVVDGRPDDVAALLRAALALVEAKGDLHQAQRFAQRACELRPDDVAARRTLGRVYLAAGLQLNARRELERAALLDPTDQIVKNLLGELKG